MRHCLRKTAGAAVAALMGCVCALAACAPSEKGEVQAELVISDETHVVIEVTAGDPAYSLYDVLALFVENGEISVEGSESEYGFYITSVNGTQADTESYWAVYTTLGTMDGVRYSDPTYGTWSYEGRELASASYGVSGLPAVTGEVYALVWTSLASA